MYYLKKPSDDLVRKVSEAIKVKISPMYKSDWIDFFSIPELEIYWSKDFKFDYIKDEDVKSFVLNILNRQHLKKMKVEALAELEKKYNEYMHIFRDNLSLMGFTIIVLSKKRIWEDAELYTSKPI